jgi:hypothetical protein
MVLAAFALPALADETSPRSFAYDQMAVDVPGHLDQAVYPLGSAERAAFDLINGYRQQCGFPAMDENSVLDEAARRHAHYQAVNQTMSDAEDTSAAAFLGVTGQDRAEALGWPRNVFAGSDDSTFYMDRDFTTAQYGLEIAYGWVAAVYHAPTLFYPMHQVGIAIEQTRTRTRPQVWASMENGQVMNRVAGDAAPLTFPCEGTRDIPYSADHEFPPPPDTHGAFGAPVVVMGDLADHLRLDAGEMRDPDGRRIALRLLDADNDPNHIIGGFAAVAYPLAPLQPNTRYEVTISGSDNGRGFVRHFSFQTGDRAS